MAYSMLLQDWITVQGNNNTLTQNEADWVEIPAFQDAAFYLEISQLTGAASAQPFNLDIQASPTKEDVFFGAAPSPGNAWVVNFNYVSTPALGVQPIQYARWSAASTTQALAKYLRWKIRWGNAAQSITFRIWLSLNQAGWA